MKFFDSVPGRLGRWVFMLLVFLLAGVWIIADRIGSGNDQVVQPPPPAVPQQFYGMVVEGMHITRGKVKRNQQFADLLEGATLGSNHWRGLLTLPRKLFDFRQITAGGNYAVVADPRKNCSAVALIYEHNPVHFTIFHFGDSLWLESCDKDVETVERSVSGIIETSLYETIERLGISHALTNRFVDIFGWQVDFFRLQRGDRFKILYSENRVAGVPIGIGQIAGIVFEHEGRSRFAFPFNQGEALDYFDEQGNSLRKALLKYPIEFTSIGSRYSMARFHPVLKVMRPHLGTDLSAPMGTPIRTVGDGTVEEAGYREGNGNYVKIRHNATYSTGYLHMSRIGDGIRPGAKVTQGQTIGYVGSTGWSTGPHLCYRFWKQGVQVDALTVELPPAAPIRPEDRAAFNVFAGEMSVCLEQIHYPAEGAH